MNPTTLTLEAYSDMHIQFYDAFPKYARDLEALNQSVMVQYIQLLTLSPIVDILHFCNDSTYTVIGMLAYDYHCI